MGVLRYMIKFNELKPKLGKAIELALEIKKLEKNCNEIVDLDIDNIEDLAYTKEERVLVSYLETLTDDEVHALISIMYLGRDGYLEFDGNSDEALSYYMELIDNDEKDIEISMMLDKSVLYDYLVKGRFILMDRNKI